LASANQGLMEEVRFVTIERRQQGPQDSVDGLAAAIS